MRMYKQSRAMFRELSKKTFIKTSEELYSSYPDLFFKKVKGPYCYDLDGNKYADFNLNNGRLPFGHAPAFLTHTVKNAVSAGFMDGMIKTSLYRFYKNLSKRISISGKYNFFIIESKQEIYSGLEGIDTEKTVFIKPMDLMKNSDDTLLKNAVKNQRDKGNMLVFDETETAFCFENGTFINNYMPDVSILNGSLGVNAAVVKKDIEVNFNNLYIPSSLQLQRASEILRNLDGRRNPFSYIEKNVKQLNKSIENKITGYYGIYPVIKLGGELQRKALNEGFIISGNGVIFISSVHDEKLIHRFTKFLNKN